MHSLIDLLFSQHPSYGSGAGSYPNDIGTLHFSALSTNSEVGTISLDAGGSLSGCQISGWGVTTSEEMILRLYFK